MTEENSGGDGASGAARRRRETADEAAMPRFGFRRRRVELNFEAGLRCVSAS